MNNNTDNTSNVNTNNSSNVSRWKEAANDLVYITKKTIKLAFYSVGIVILTAVGTYFGINYYNVEQDMINEQLYPLSAKQVSDVTQLVRTASRYMDRIEASQYSDNKAEATNVVEVKLEPTTKSFSQFASEYIEENKPDYAKCLEMARQKVHERLQQEQ